MYQEFADGNNVADARREHSSSQLSTASALGSMVSMPIYGFTVMASQGQVLGVLGFATAESQRVYGDSDLSLASDLAHRAAIALQNARLLRALRQADRAKDIFLARTHGIDDQVAHRVGQPRLHHVEAEERVHPVFENLPQHPHRHRQAE